MLFSIILLINCNKTKCAKNSNKETVYDIIEWIFSSRAKELVTFMEEWLTMDIIENELQKCDDLNRVELSGTIVGILDKDYVTRVTLGITTSYKNNLYYYYPYIYFEKKHGVSIDGFALYDKVDILAEAVSRKINLEDSKTRKRQELCGVAIKKAGEMYEPRKAFFCREDKKHYSIGHNKIYLEGKVSGIYRASDGVYGLSIKNQRNGKVNNINLYQYTETKPDIPNGTRVAIEAVIKTRSKESGGHNNHFQDFKIWSVRVLD